MKRKIIIPILLVFSLLAGCGNKTPTPTGGNEQSDTLVIGTSQFDGKFSPFFYTNAYENDVLALVHLNLLGTDREGSVVLRGIEGEVRPYNGTDYTYTGIANCVITENPDGTVYYDFTLREGITFSDGTPLDIDDVIFSLYVPLDPTYDGTMTLYSLPIQGLEAYRSGIQTRAQLILADGAEGYQENPYYTRQQYDTFWAAFWAAGEEFTRSMQRDGENPAKFFASLIEKHGFDLSAEGLESEAADISFADALEQALGSHAGDYSAGVQTGNSAPNISGIQKTGDNSLRIVLTEVSATAIYNFVTAIVPMHYYGDEALYDYEDNMFGFTKGDLSDVRSVTTAPMGGGPYQFVSYTGGTVTLEANSRYWKGAPKTRYIQFREGQEADKVSGIVAGTIDITDPSYSTETAKAIADANASDAVIHAQMVANLGYGYVGMNAKNVCVGGEPGSDASKNLRKAIATVIAAYRDVAVDSYYGAYANVINYAISDTSWAAPRVTDPGYQVAFSVDADGLPIYTDDMTPEARYAAARDAALGYFKAAGYTVEQGRVTAAPQGAQMEYEVLVGAGGTGEHPTFMALTLAAEALQQIGFRLIVTDLSNFSELSNAVNAGTAELFAMAWSATADPDLFQVYHSQGGSNEKAYFLKDDQLDELILLARQSTDQTYRKTLYKACLDIIADWAVEIPVYQRQNVFIFSAQRIDLNTLTPDITTFWGWENDIENLQMK